MDSLLELLNELGIEYVVPEKEDFYMLTIHYNGEEIECDCYHSSDNDLLYVEIAIRDIAYPEADSFIASNFLRGDCFSCAIYPNIGILNHRFIIPSQMDNKKEFLVNELNYFIEAKNDYEEKYNEIHKEESYDIKDRELYDFIKRQDDTLYERNIIEDAINLSRSLDLANPAYFI